MTEEQSTPLRDIVATTPQYAPEAYILVLEALNRTAQWVRDGRIKPLDVGERQEGHSGFHISGKELLEGLRLYALDQYGDMAHFLLQRWGLRRTEDVGEIVFTLIEHKHLKRRECDSRDDFANGYDFDTAFQQDIDRP